MGTEHDRDPIPRRKFPSLGHDPERRLGSDRRAVEEEVVLLVPDFIENRRRDAEAIPHLAHAGAFGQVQRLGHNMKGCGVSYGFPSISEIGRDLSAAAKQGNVNEILRLNNELSRILESLPHTGPWHGD
ncbi:MAG: hypothetical protein HY904_03035 [Deltaproteobacteria bacterium]|nr:hypothetical protein [Deltaproteobacteria bacterium]